MSSSIASQQVVFSRGTQEVYTPVALEVPKVEVRGGGQIIRPSPVIVDRLPRISPRISARNRPL